MLSCDDERSDFGKMREADLRPRFRLPRCAGRLRRRFSALIGIDAYFAFGRHISRWPRFLSYRLQPLKWPAAEYVAEGRRYFA